MPTPITLEELTGRLAAGERPTLVEALGPDWYGDVHLPNALNLPPGQVEARAPRLLPDRDAPVVVYCSRTCSNADAVAAALEQLGYTNVRVYRGGKEEWIEAGLPVERPS